ncbi:unnamed protein product [Auanema sp. JU1783]|nr:unnamed protein product [Auanema sp. JU1783]
MEPFQNAVMGQFDAYFKKLDNTKKSIQENYSVQLIFPTYGHHREKFLQAEQNQAKILNNMRMVYLGLVETSMGAMIGLGAGSIPAAYYRVFMTFVRESPVSFGNDLLSLKGEKMLVETVENELKAEMKTIERQLELAETSKDKQIPFAIADNTCYKILQKIDTSSFILHKEPLVLAPFFVFFATTYIAVAGAYCQLNPQHRADAMENLKKLRWRLNNLCDKTVYSRQCLVETKKNDWIFGRSSTCIDTLTNKTIFRETISGFTMSQLDDIEEWYKNELATTYKQFFKPTLKALDDFITELKQPLKQPESVSWFSKIF